MYPFLIHTRLSLLQWREKTEVPHTVTGVKVENFSRNPFVRVAELKSFLTPKMSRAGVPGTVVCLFKMTTVTF